MKMEQQASDDEKLVNEVVTNEENRIEGNSFTSGVSPKNNKHVGYTNYNYEIEKA